MFVFNPAFIYSLFWILKNGNPLINPNSLVINDDKGIGPFNQSLEHNWEFKTTLRIT